MPSGRPPSAFKGSPRVYKGRSPAEWMRGKINNPQGINGEQGHGAIAQTVHNAGVRLRNTAVEANVKAHGFIYNHTGIGDNKTVGQFAKEEYGKAKVGLHNAGVAVRNRATEMGVKARTAVYSKTGLGDRQIAPARRAIQNATDSVSEHAHNALTAIKQKMIGAPDHYSGPSNSRRSLKMQYSGPSNSRSSAAVMSSSPSNPRRSLKTQYSGPSNPRGSGSAVSTRSGPINPRGSGAEIARKRNLAAVSRGPGSNIKSVLDENFANSAAKLQAEYDSKHRLPGPNARYSRAGRKAPRPHR